MKETMKEIMSTAWQIAREFGWSIGRSLRMAWTWFRLRARMMKEVVTFRYIKCDGTLRTARGTLKADMIPSHTDGRGSLRKQSNAVQVYYDLDKQGWRCFKKCNLLNVE